MEPLDTHRREERTDDADLERGDSNGTASEKTEEGRKEGHNNKEDKEKSSSKKSEDEDKQQNFMDRVKASARKIPLVGTVELGWIPNNLNWSKIKPALRSALLAWVSLLFVIIPKLSVMLGQVSSFSRAQQTADHNTKQGQLLNSHRYHFQCSYN